MFQSFSLRRFAGIWCSPDILVCVASVVDGFCNVGRVYCGLGLCLLVLVEVVRYVFLSGSL